MVLSDIISTPFIISIIITLLLVGGIAYFLLEKIKEQDRKIYSMMDLVTTMAGEINTMKKIQFGGAPPSGVVPFSMNEVPPQYLGKNELIEVSDGDVDEDDDEDEYEDESEPEEEESEPESDDSDNDSEEEEQGDSEPRQIKHINIDYGLMTIDENEIEELEDDENDDEDEDDGEEASENGDELEMLSLNDSIKDDSSLEAEETPLEMLPVSEDKIEESIVDDEIQEQEQEIQKTDLSLLKTINISLEESAETKHDDTDYKKMSLNKLRTVVVDKGLVTDASKLKKHELLKLLDSE